MKPLLFLLFVFLYSVAQGQQCNCETEFVFLKNYMEANHPGLNSGLKNNDDYRKRVKSLAAEIRRNKPGNDCILYLQDYFTLLKDHHIYINPVIPSFRRYNVNSPKSLDSLYQSALFRSTEQYKLDSFALARRLATKPEQDIEGWYRDAQGSLIAFVKAPKEKWTYKGVVVSSKTKLFPPGTVRYQLRPRSTGLLWAMVTLPDHQQLYTAVPSSADGLSFIGLKRADMKRSGELALAGKSPFEFHALDSQTNYLRVSSFDASLTMTLDSFYNAIDSQVQSKPFLVIDVRNNGGGSDASFFGLFRHLYTKPVYGDEVQIWVSPENIKRYEESLAAKKARPGDYSQQAIEYEASLIDRLKNARPYSFIPLIEGTPTPITAQAVQANPSRIVVLMNKGCASAAESFIYYASQSDKVTTMGDNSKGMMGYGNVLTATTPCYGYHFGTTTTRYSQFSRYEFVGITPEVRLTEKQDWIREALQFLAK